MTLPNPIEPDLMQVGRVDWKHRWSLLRDAIDAIILATDHPVAGNQSNLSDGLRDAASPSSLEAAVSEKVTAPTSTAEIESNSIHTLNAKYVNIQSVDLIPADIKSAPYFRSLLINLRGFVERLKGRGYLDEDNENNWDSPYPFAKAYALNIILNQVSQDLVVISHAARQRRVVEFKAALEKADRLAAELIRPAVDIGLFKKLEEGEVVQGSSPGQPLEPPPIVLTYFQKVPTVRVMPYSPIALVGIPYSAFYVDDGVDEAKEKQEAAAQELLALVHELGHLVFWKGHVNSYVEGGEQYPVDAKFASFLNRQLRREDLSPWTGDSAEQLVADAYGACVAGLAAGIMSQERAVARQLDRYFADDLRYQILPEVRPEIYYYTLGLNPKAKQVYSVGQKGDKREPLLERWNQVLARWQNPTYTNGGNEKERHIMLRPYGGSQEVSLRTVSNELEKATELVNDILLKVEMPEALAKLYEANTFEQSLAAWAQFVNGVCRNDPAGNRRDLMTVKEAEDLAEKALGGFYVGLNPSDEEEGYWEEGPWGLWKDLLLDQEERQQVEDGVAKPGEVTALQKWKTLLYAGGWATESPGNSGAM